MLSFGGKRAYDFHLNEKKKHGTFEILLLISMRKLLKID